MLERDFLYFIRGSESLEFHVIQKLFRCQNKSFLTIPQDFYGILKIKHL